MIVINLIFQVSKDHKQSLKKKYFLKIYFIEVELIYNVVLISDVQHSGSVIHIFLKRLSAGETNLVPFS